MKITDALKQEHVVFIGMFDELDGMLTRNAEVAELKAKAALLAVGLISHANLERDTLFAALPNLGGGAGPIDVMKLEHDEIERGFVAIADESDAAKVRDALAHLLALARQHFDKEEQMLFVMAQEFLGEQTLVALGADFEERRRSSALATA